MIETLIKNKLGLEILTDTGWSKFDGIVNKGVMHTITVKLKNASVTLTLDHNVFLSSMERFRLNS